MSLSYAQATASIETRLPVSKGDNLFWRKSAPVVKNSEVLRGGMFPHQLKWWELPNFIKVMVGGYGSGKTLIGSKRIISLALQNAPCPVAYVSPSFPLARETTIVTIKTLLQGKRSLYGRQFWWTYNGSSHEFKIRFHGRQARIIIYSGDKPLSLRGPNLAAAGIDEPFIQEKEVYSQMIARIRHPDAVHRELFLTGTPEQLNWGYDLCIGEDSEGQDVGVVHASTRENLVLDSGYIKRLLGTFSKRAAEAYVEGEFVNLAEGMVYYSFDPSAHMVSNPWGTSGDGKTYNGQYIPEAAELGVGMDFNVDPMAGCVFAMLGDHLHIIEEIELGNADTEFMCEVIREKYGKRVNDVYPDATGAHRHSSSPGGKTDFWYIEQAGFEINANAGNPRRKDRYNSVNGKLKSSDGKITLTISPKCKKLRKYMQTYSHELMKKQKQMSHLLDAFSYPVAYLFPPDRDRTTIYQLQGG